MGKIKPLDFNGRVVCFKCYINPNRLDCRCILRSLFHRRGLLGVVRFHIRNNGKCHRRIAHKCIRDIRLVRRP